MSALNSQRALKEFLKKIHRIAFLYYPLSAGGTILFVIALVLLLRGLSFQNPYALLLSLAALLLLILLVFLGRLQAIRFKRVSIHWDSSSPLYARKSGPVHWLHSEAGKTKYFFRFHCHLSGRMTVGQNASLFLYRKIALVQVADHPLPLYFPLSGTWAARIRYEIRDIFGLTRSGFGLPPVRMLTVHPAPLERFLKRTIDPALGYEDKSRKKSSEEEKYYMREYIPGDRLRDINWKASSRLAVLITRISPVTQEKTRQISIDFRHFWKKKRETVESIAHLNAIKSRLLAFIRENKREHPEYRFRIRTARGIHLLETEEDIRQFSSELSSLFYQGDPYSLSPLSVAGDLFIFTTVFDETLSASALPRAKIHLFTTSRGRGEAIRIFEAEAFPVVPGTWALRRERIEAAPTTLPGWAAMEQVALDVKAV